jgi:cell division protein FtsI/penicillin-binding protein 2
LAGKLELHKKAAPGGGGYHPDKYYASFVGFFPTSDPVIVMSVVVDENPRGLAAIMEVPLRTSVPKILRKELPFTGLFPLIKIWKLIQ